MNYNGGRAHPIGNLVGPEKIYPSHVGNGTEEEGMRNLAAVQLLSYLYNEPDEIKVGRLYFPMVSEKNPAFVLWADMLGLDPRAVAESMKAAAGRLVPFSGCTTCKVDTRI